MHEASLWDNNLFLTLTYDDEHLEEHCGWEQTLNRQDLTGFLKRLRKALPGSQRNPLGKRAIRFFAAGEYGERTKRPHYHLLLFNLQLADLRRFGGKTSTSDTVSGLWPWGHHLVGTVTAASAAYVARYATKKLSGAAARAAAYGVVNPATGEYTERAPEFGAMSLKPGIGRWWFERFKSDLRNGFVVTNGTKAPIPRYYRDKYKGQLSGPELLAMLERVYERNSQMTTDKFGRTSYELEVDEAVQRSKDGLNPQSGRF